MHDKRPCWCLVDKRKDTYSTTHCMRHGKSVMSTTLFDSISDRLTHKDNEIEELKGEIENMKNKNSDMGKAIATAGIWLGVGLASFHCGMFTVIIAMCAMAVTADIWES